MHALIIGRTLSGKTTWAVKKAKSLKKLHNYSIIVFDPFLDPRWQNDVGADFVTNDQDEFLEAVWNNKKCAVFVDESGAAVGKYNKLMDKLATQGRHWGHKIYFITQRAKQISTTVRTQCSELIIFKTSKADTKDLADEFVDNKINEAENLNKGEFLYVRDGIPTERYNVFDL